MKKGTDWHRNRWVITACRALTSPNRRRSLDPQVQVAFFPDSSYVIRSSNHFGSKSVHPRSNVCGASLGFSYFSCRFRRYKDLAVLELRIARVLTRYLTLDLSLHERLKRQETNHTFSEFEPLIILSEVINAWGE